MFVGLAVSVVFTFVYATAAARLPRAEKVLIPVLALFGGGAVSEVEVLPGAPSAASAVQGIDERRRAL